jgi:hypothetical protein
MLAFYKFFLFWNFSKLFTWIELRIAALTHGEATMKMNVLPFAITFVPNASLFGLMRVSNSLSVVKF